MKIIQESPFKISPELKQDILAFVEHYGNKEQESGALFCKVDDNIILDKQNQCLGGQCEIGAESWKTMIKKGCTQGEKIGTIHVHTGITPTSDYYYNTLLPQYTELIKDLAGPKMPDAAAKAWARELLQPWSQSEASVIDMIALMNENDLVAHCSMDLEDKKLFCYQASENIGGQTVIRNYIPPTFTRRRRKHWEVHQAYGEIPAKNGARELMDKFITTYVTDLSHD